MTIVKLDGVARRYGRVEAITPSSLVIDKGETVALLGPSGSGKTTLLMLIAGIIEPTVGRVILNGHDLSEMGHGRALSRLVGMIHQQFDLVPGLSVIHNVLAGRLGEWSLIRSIASLIWHSDRHVGIEALKRVGMAELETSRASQLSGGEQQRVAIARLLVQSPAVILADEPVHSLDPARAQEVLQLLINVSREGGKTLISSMHSVDLARHHFGRLIGLRNGIIQFDLSSQKVTPSMLSNLYELKGLRGEN